MMGRFIMKSFLPKNQVGYLSFCVDVSLMLISLSAAKYPKDFYHLGQHTGHPNLPDLIYQYLIQQATSDMDQDAITHETVYQAEHVKVFHSARAIFCAPSNPSSTSGLYCETIRATPSWNLGEIPGPRYDCIFVASDQSSDPGMDGFLVARVLLFFSFTIDAELHQCALVHWFSTHGIEPDPDNGMWIVTPDGVGRSRNISVIHIDSVVRAAHLLPIFDDRPIPHTLNYTKTLDEFEGFYVNSLIDYHAYETVF